MIAIEDFLYFNAEALPNFVKMAEDNLEWVDHKIKCMDFSFAREIARVTTNNLIDLLGIKDVRGVSEKERMDRIVNQISLYAERACDYDPDGETTDWIERLETAVDTIYCSVYC